jgi:putative ABC transport system permease protein
MFQDIRYGISTMLKSPGFTIVAVVALALGIGATTQAFSIVNTVLIKPLPFKDSERLVAVWGGTLTQERVNVSPADYFDWKEQSQAFETLAASRGWAINLTGSGEPEHLRGYRVTGNFFQMLGVEASLGRTFDGAEDQPGKEHVVVLSNKLWKRRFGSDPNIINQTIMLNQESYTVIGVMPADFRYPRGSAELWSPIALSSADAKDRKAYTLLVTGRIKPGFTVDSAEADIATVARRLQEQFPATNAGYNAWVMPLRDMILGPAAQDLKTALVAAFLVLLIACANISSMLLARGAARQKEVAVRLALGATRVRLIRQFLTECLILSLVGGVIGILLADWGIKALVANIPSFISDVNPRMLDIGLNGESALFSIGLSFFAVMVFGLAPAFLSSKSDVYTVLKEGVRGSTGGIGRLRIRSILVVTEVALAVILLVGAGLLLRSYGKAQSISPGFDINSTLTMSIPLTRSQHPTSRQVATFYQQALEEVKALPGIQAAGVISDLPFDSGNNMKSLIVEGQPAPLPAQQYRAHYRVISPGYFQSQAIPFIQGRDFGEKDVEGPPPAVVISEALANQFWPQGDAVGKRLMLQGESDYRQVVGVVGNIKDWDLVNKSQLYVYVPYSLDQPEYFMTLVVRSNNDPGTLIPAVRNRIHSVDPDQPVGSIKTMEKVVFDTRAPQRINMVGLAVLATISIILAATGIYGLISYSVAQRTREMGIRMAVGAKPADVLSLVMKQGLRLTLIGLMSGLLGALLLTRGMASLLYGISVMDPLTYAIVSVLLASTAVLATFFPARRASRIEPMVALRSE